MIRQAARSEAARLVHAVVAETDTRAEAAIARLIVLGERALPHVRQAARTGLDEAAARRLLRVLETQPPSRRTLATLDAILAGQSATIIEAASAIWSAWLAHDDRRAAALAFDHVAATALDPRGSSALRLAAVRALRTLPVPPGSLMATLSEDADLAIRRAAAEDARPAAAVAPDPLGSLDDPEAVRRKVTERGPALPLADLHHWLERLQARASTAAPADAPQWLAARAALHQVLASRGSTVALYDLRELLERMTEPPPVALMAALTAIGDPSCLAPLVSAWDRIDDAWTRAHLATALSAICERHRPSRRHPVVKDLLARQHPLAAALPIRRGGR